MVLGNSWGVGAVDSWVVVRWTNLQRRQRSRRHLPLPRRYTRLLHCLLFVFYKHTKGVLEISCKVCCSLVLFRSSLHLHPLARRLQTGLVFRFLHQTCSIWSFSFHWKSFVSVSYLVEIVFVTGIFSNASTWVLGIEPSSSPLHVGSSGMYLLLSMKLFFLILFTLYLSDILSVETLF